MAILESAACGVPVVSFNVGGIPSLLETAPSAWLVPSGNVDALDCALRDMIVDFPRTSREADQWAESLRPNFSPSAVLTAYLNLYAAVSSTSAQ